MSPIRLSDVDWLGLDVKWQLQRVRAYFETVDSWVQGLANERAKKIADIPGGLSDEDYFAEVQLIDTELEYQVDSVTRTFRYSAAVMLFTAVEIGLRRLSKTVIKSVSVPFKPKEIVGSELERYKLFFVRQCGVDFGNIPWESIRTLQTVRDCIVHCAGYIDDLNEKDQVFLRKVSESPSSGLRIEEPLVEAGDEVLQVGAEFVQMSIKSISELFDALIGQVRSKGFVK